MGVDEPYNRFVQPTSLAYSVRPSNFMMIFLDLSFLKKKNQVKKIIESSEIRTMSRRWATFLMASPTYDAPSTQIMYGQAVGSGTCVFYPCIVALTLMYLRPCNTPLSRNTAGTLTLLLRRVGLFSLTFILLCQLLVLDTSAAQRNTQESELLDSHLLQFDRTSQARRPFAVFTSAGDKSQENVRAWFESNADRDYDVIVAYYGDLTFKPNADIVFARKGTKFPNFKWFSENHPDILNNYKAIAVWDDDVQIAPRNIVATFRNLQRASNVTIMAPCQMAAEHASLLNGGIGGIRQVHFVEMNAPVFKMVPGRFDESFLGKFIKVFPAKLLGWGTDLMYSALCMNDLSCLSAVSDDGCFLNPSYCHANKDLQGKKCVGGTKEIDIAQPMRDRQRVWKNVKRKFLEQGLFRKHDFKQILTTQDVKGLNLVQSRTLVAGENSMCEIGIKSDLLPKDGGAQACCQKSCGTCSHPLAACIQRSGGKTGCCPSFIKRVVNRSCATNPPPCVLDSRATTMLQTDSHAATTLTITFPPDVDEETTDPGADGSVLITQTDNVYEDEAKNADYQMQPSATIHVAVIGTLFLLFLTVVFFYRRR